MLGRQDIGPGDDWNDLRWTSDGLHLTIAWDGGDGIDNIWTQQVGGGNERQRTFLDQPDEIRAFAWSPDGTQLVIATGRETGDVVLLEGF